MLFIFLCFLMLFMLFMLMFEAHGSLQQKRIGNCNNKNRFTHIYILSAFNICFVPFPLNPKIQSSKYFKMFYSLVQDS